MRFEFQPEALQEYREAAAYYESKRPGLGDRFVNEVEKIIRQIEATPERFRIIDSPVRRALTRIFPYGILYTIQEDSVLILAVMHCHRAPRYWISRKPPA